MSGSRFTGLPSGLVGCVNRQTIHFVPNVHNAELYNTERSLVSEAGLSFAANCSRCDDGDIEVLLRHHNIPESGDTVNDDECTTSLYDL